MARTLPFTIAEEFMIEEAPLVGPLQAMNRRYNTPWWASRGNGPLRSGPDNPQLNSRMTILECLCKNGPLYAVETRYGGKKYGKVEVKGGRIYINSFQLKKPNSPTEIRFISFQELLSRFNNGSIELPRTVFFLVTRLGRANSFEIIIKTEELSPRVKNFILLSSALKGPTYKAARLIYSCYTYCNINFPTSPVIEGIRNDDPVTPFKDGGVYGTDEGSSNVFIALEDITNDGDFKLGVVVAGLKKLKERRGKTFLIKECGLMIDPLD